MAGPRVAPQTMGGAQPQVTPAEAAQQQQPAQQPILEVTLGPIAKVTIGSQTNPTDGQLPEAKPQPPNGGETPGLWAGFPEKAPEGRPPQGEQDQLPDFDIPIFPTYRRTDREIGYNRERREDRDDEDRYRPDRNYNANRANLRRGVIRDYLQQNLQNAILESGINDRSGLQQLTRTVADQLARTFNDPLMVTDKVLKTIEKEITNLLRNDLRTDLNFTDNRSRTITFDRAAQISELLLKYIPHEFSKQFRDITPQKMLDGMILLHLLAHPGGSLDDMRRIMNCKPSILPEGMVWANFRDTGLLVALLWKNSLSLNDRSLDLAVQRFVKLLVAKNEIGILLAAMQLTGEARSGQMPHSRVAALVQVYELIGQLMRNAERAMKEATASAAPRHAELGRTDRGLAFSGAMESNDAEAALRNYLAFNPAAQSDSGASAFFSEELAETSARIAVDSSQREIVDWLNSGRHRFVTEVDLGKPIGIVIDRVSDECFTASQIRIVLVRDGSVLGWHILRSSLVG